MEKYYYYDAQGLLSSVTVFARKEGKIVVKTDTGKTLIGDESLIGVTVFPLEHFVKVKKELRKKAEKTPPKSNPSKTTYKKNSFEPPDFAEGTPQMRYRRWRRK